MRGASIPAAICAAAVSCGAADASPWNRADGAVFVASRFDYFTSSTPVSRYERYGSDTYAEFGLTPKWMITGKSAYGTSLSDSALGQSSRTGFGESELAVQRQIRRGLHSATAVSIAGAYAERLADGARAEFGEHGFDAEIRALHGRDIVLSPVKIFATAEVAFRRRFDDAADQVRADMLVGVEASSRFLILAEARTQISLRNEGPLGDDVDIAKARAAIVWRASRRWSILAGGEKEFMARGVIPGRSLFVGLWSEF